MARRRSYPPVAYSDQKSIVASPGTLARDGSAEPEPATGGIRFGIGVQVDSSEEVNRLTERMRAAGARVTCPSPAG